MTSRLLCGRVLQYRAAVRSNFRNILARCPQRHQSMGQALSVRLASSSCAILRAQDRDALVLAAAAEDSGDIWLIVGLGNPGPRYAGNRHNVGFMALDALAQAEGISLKKLQDNAAVGRGRVAGQRVLLAKPMTFMNASGESVGRLARFYKVPIERVIVLYDDLDIPSATVRLRAKGGHGGHNGMRSIQQHLQGSKDFPRIRIGVGRPPGSITVINHVLQDFSPAEREEINVAIREAVAAVRSVLMLGMEKSLSGQRV